MDSSEAARHDGNTDSTRGSGSKPVATRGDGGATCSRQPVISASDHSKDADPTCAPFVGGDVNRRSRQRRDVGMSEISVVSQVARQIRGCLPWLRLPIGCSGPSSVPYPLLIEGGIGRLQKTVCRRFAGRGGSAVAGRAPLNRTPNGGDCARGKWASPAAAIRGLTTSPARDGCRVPWRSTCRRHQPTLTVGIDSSQTEQ
jgi:hypothetical protein